MRVVREKVVLITGSANGIGAETAHAFAREGARLVLTYHRDKKAAEMTAQRCKDAGSPQVMLLELDISSDASIDAAVKKTISMFGFIHVLVNNAGMALWKKLQDQTYGEIHMQIGTNLEGLIKMTRSFLGFTRESIINIGSGAGFSGYADLSVYCATKFGVRGFTQALAEERPDLRIFCVNPGMTATRMTGFRGLPPIEVAAIIVKAAKGEYGVPNGSDLNVWDLVKV
jgi:NAD(P)-dependent dehydrogenase (short-subunit alcohol dehydrogenase family)